MVTVREYIKERIAVHKRSARLKIIENAGEEDSSSEDEISARLGGRKARRSGNQLESKETPTKRQRRPQRLPRVQYIQQPDTSVFVKLESNASSWRDLPLGVTKGRIRIVRIERGIGCLGRLECSREGGTIDLLYLNLLEALEQSKPINQFSFLG